MPGRSVPRADGRSSTPASGRRGTCGAARRCRASARACRTPPPSFPSRGAATIRTGTAGRARRCIPGRRRGPLRSPRRCARCPTGHGGFRQAARVLAGAASTKRAPARRTAPSPRASVPEQIRPFDVGPCDVSLTPAFAARKNTASAGKREDSRKESVAQSTS